MPAQCRSCTALPRNGFFPHEYTQRPARSEAAAGAGGFVAVSVFAGGRFTRLETLWGMLISCVFLVYSIAEWRGLVATKRHSIRHSYDSISYRTKGTAERAQRSITDIVHYEERLWRPTKIHFKDGTIRMSSHAWGASALRDQITRMIEERT